MRCRRARGMLRELAGGSVPPEERTSLQRHLGACPACAREARTLEVTRRLLGVLVEGEGPSSAFCQRPWRRLAAIREGKVEAERDAFSTFARHLIPAAAVTVVLLGGLAYLVRPLEPSGIAPLDRFLESGAAVPEEAALLSGTATLTQDDVLALVLARGRGVPVQ